MGETVLVGGVDPAPGATEPDSQFEHQQTPASPILLGSVASVPSRTLAKINSMGRRVRRRVKTPGASRRG
jgi:hypothetical protein